MHLTRDAGALLGGGQRADVVEQHGRVEAEGELVGDLEGPLVQLRRPAGHADEDAVAEHLLGAAQGHHRRPRGALPLREADLRRQALGVVARVQRAERLVGIHDEDRRPGAPAGALHGALEVGGQRGAVEPEAARACETVDPFHQLVGGGVRRLARRHRAGRARLEARQQSHAQSDREPGHRLAQPSQGVGGRVRGDRRRRGQDGHERHVEGGDETVAHPRRDRRDGQVGTELGRGPGGDDESGDRHGLRHGVPVQRAVAGQPLEERGDRGGQDEHHEDRRGPDEGAVAERRARGQCQGEHAHGGRRAPGRQRGAGRTSVLRRGGGHQQVTCSRTSRPSGCRPVP